MLRSLTCRILESGITQHGYRFYTGFGYRIPEGKLQFPAAWLNPIQLTKVDGREDGHLTYKCTFHLMHLQPKHNPVDKEMLWDQMEQAAVQIVRSLRQAESVFTVDCLQCTPAELSLSNQGEVSLKVEIEIQLYFNLHKHD